MRQRNIKCVERRVIFTGISWGRIFDADHEVFKILLVKLEKKGIPFFSRKRKESSFLSLASLQQDERATYHLRAEIWSLLSWQLAHAQTLFSPVVSPGDKLREPRFVVPEKAWTEKRGLDIGHITVEPRFNEPLFNEVFDITNNILGPSQIYSKMYGIEPRYNEFFDITNIIRKPERRIYLDTTNYNVNTRQKINAELINSQQIL